MRSIVKRHNVDFNILCTVHAANQNHALKVYRFFRDELDARYLQFIPIVERVSEAQLAQANEGWSERPGGDRPLYESRVASSPSARCRPRTMDDF